MALGFIKKMFSFGKKEEAQDTPAPDAEQLPVEVTPEAPEVPVVPVEPDPVEVTPVEAAAVEAAPVEAAPTSRSPLRGGSVGEAERGGVLPSSSAAEPTPSGPTDHLPLKGGEEVAPSAIDVSDDVQEAVEAETVEAAPFEPASVEAAPVEAAPTSPSHLSEGSVGEAERGGDIPSSSAAELTPAGPADHLPLKGGEEVEPDTSVEVAPHKIIVTDAVEKKVEAAPVEVAPQPKLSWYQRLSQGLSRSSRQLSESISGVFTKRKLDEDTLQDLEDVLLRADLGMETALRVTDTLASGRYGKEVSGEEVRSVMAHEIEKVLTPVARPLELDLSHKPHVILVVGVNGTGKTTTIGKLAAKLTAGGLKVMLAAGDTFRAAAIEQLKIWGERTGSPVVSSKLGADAAGLAYDAYEKAKEAGSDVLIIDTAGRLQNKAELMAELEKVVRVLGKHDPDAPHTVLQTVDATTGQNALNQVEIFRNVAGVNGLVMTKLDGTARGGILVAIAAKHKLPVYFIGVGEQVDDLEPFSANEFAKAIAGVN